MEALAADAAGMRAALEAMLARRVAQRRAAVVTAFADLGVEAVVEGDAVRASGRGIMARWWRDLALREAGRGRR